MNAESTVALGNLGVIRLTTGTIISDATIAAAPTSEGDANFKNAFDTISPTANTMLTQQATLVVRFQNSPYMNGPRNDPARAPHESPISAVIMLLGYAAISTDSTINSTQNARSSAREVFSLILSVKLPRKSRTTVDDEIITSDASVDIEADTTISTIPMECRAGCRGIVG